MRAGGQKGVRKMRDAFGGVVTTLRGEVVRLLMVENPLQPVAEANEDVDMHMDCIIVPEFN